jgi:hypothetical protein
VTEPPPPPGTGTPPPVRTPAQKKKQKRRKKPGQRTIWTYVFFGVIALIVLVGLLQLALDLFGDKEPALGDHIHALLMVDICGGLQENPPTFETRAGGNERAGLHSHGDGLMHIHPFTDDETGAGATVGLFFEEGGWSLSEDGIDLTNDNPERQWSDVNVGNGAPCLDGRPGEVRWAVNGQAQDGNPADFAPEDGDRIIIYFLPEADALPDEKSVIDQRPEVGAALKSALEGKSVDQKVEQ